VLRSKLKWNRRRPVAESSGSSRTKLFVVKKVSEVRRCSHTRGRVRVTSELVAIPKVVIDLISLVLRLGQRVCLSTYPSTAYLPTAYQPGHPRNP